MTVVVGFVSPVGVVLWVSAVAQLSAGLVGEHGLSSGSRDFSLSLFSGLLLPLSSPLLFSLPLPWLEAELLDEV